MIDIAKARAICAAPLTRAIRIQKCILLPEALDALEEEQDSKKRGWALAMEHADTVNALKAEVERLKDGMLRETERAGSLVRMGLDLEADNARLREALRAAIPYVSATSINADMWAALAPATSKETL